MLVYAQQPTLWTHSGGLRRGVHTTSEALVRRAIECGPGRPLVMFEDLEFKTPASARRAATRLKRERGEASPIRSI